MVAEIGGIQAGRSEEEELVKDGELEKRSL